MKGALGFDPDAVLTELASPAHPAELAKLAELAISRGGAAILRPAPADDVTQAPPLAAPDPDLARERGVIAETMRAEAAGALPVKSPADHRDHLAGLELSALQRPPSWADASAVPSRGAWCGRCSRHRPEAGGRWWRPAIPRGDGTGPGPGWCCATCHPPPPGCDVREAVT